MGGKVSSDIEFSEQSGESILSIEFEREIVRSKELSWEIDWFILLG